MIYLDHCAHTPADPQVTALVARLLHEPLGNAASVHAAGRRARRILDDARGELAAAIGSRPPTPDEPCPLVFTSGASEANNLALRGILEPLAAQGTPVHVVVAAIEHDSVLAPLRRMQELYANVTLSEIPANSQGIVPAEAMVAACGPDTRLAALALANHETGAIQPVAAVAAFCRARGILLHCDGVQAPGRMDFNIETLGCDTFSLAAHKFYGPLGIGALWLRAGMQLAPQILGGAHEGGLRAGTPAPALAAGMALAASHTRTSLNPEREHLLQLEAAFLENLKDEVQFFAINGPEAASDKLPGVLNISLPGAARDDLVVAMDLEGFAISAGSACASGVAGPSPVLAAMDIEPWRRESAIRISFGRGNTPAHAVAAARALGAIARRIEPKAMTTAVASQAQAGAH